MRVLNTNTVETRFLFRGYSREIPERIYWEVMLEKPVREGVFISICKPLFVTLIVNKKREYCVYHESVFREHVFRDRHVEYRRSAIFVALRRSAIYRSLSLLPPFFSFHPCVFPRSSIFTFWLGRRVSHAADIGRFVQFFYVAIVTVDVKKNRPSLAVSRKKKKYKYNIYIYVYIYMHTRPRVYTYAYIQNVYDF